MNVASPRAVRADVPLFADGLGERHVAADASTGELLQILSLAPGLAAVPSFDFAVRERTARLAHFRHASYAPVRRVERLADGRLAIVSEHVEGMRLSEMLAAAHARGLCIDTSAALSLVAQLLTAVALLHENARDVAHGLLAPERLVVTSQARLVIVEHVIGAAVEQLQHGRERLWQEFRAAVPASAGLPRLDHRADVNGIGVTALSLVLGRPLAPAEFPHAVPGLLIQARERSQLHGERPLPNGLRNWLARTLQLDVRRAFSSAPEALASLAETLAADPSCSPAPIALEAFLSTFWGVAPAAPPALADQLTNSQPAVRGPDTVPAAPSPTGAHATPSGSRAVPTLAELIPIHDLVSPPSVPAPSEAVEQPVRESYDDAVAALAPVADDDATEGPGVPPATDPGRERAEPSAPDAAPARARWLLRWWSKRTAIGAVAVVVAGVLLAVRVLSGGSESGTLVVQSSPTGVDVYVDGVHRGVTPARLFLPAGSHILELRGSGVPRVIPLQVPAGGQVSQYLEFADTPRTGMLVVHSQPAGARVTVDGVPRGTTPVTIDGLEPGPREVVLQNEHGRSHHVVKVLAGTTASLVAPVVAPASGGPVSGWISVKAPFLLEIFEKGRLIGTTETDRIMLAAGRHVLELVNQALGYRETKTVDVRPGRTLPIALDLPKGSVSLNADPWAEVWIEGRSVGETPIGNMELTIGAYEIVFRHPQLGERRHAVSVTAAAPVRLSVSMR